MLSILDKVKDRAGFMGLDLLNPNENQFRMFIAIFHPYLIAMYPVATAAIQSLANLKPVELLRSILVVLVLSVVLFYLFSKIIKPMDRAGLLTSLILMFLFQYGYYTRFPPIISILGLHIDRHIIIMLGWVIICVILINTRLWKYVRAHDITRFMNILSVLSIISIVFTFRSAFAYEFNALKDPLRNFNPPLSAIETSSTSIPLSTPPDIYYIILDDYARLDVLHEVYHYDNSSFISSLEQLGFFIASNSRSNYNQTGLSLASSLNLDYLDFLGEMGDFTNNREPLTKLVRENRLVKFLKSHGYTIIAIDSGYTLTNDVNEDIFLNSGGYIMSDFEMLMFESSAFRVPFDLANTELYMSGYHVHRDRILFSFNTISQITQERSPKFIFAHILAPHPPFVFDSGGNPLTPKRPYEINDGSAYKGTKSDYIESYNQELIYINQLVLDAVNRIISNSSVEPIIIIQADHGPGAYMNYDSLALTCIKERTSIFNAYYLPKPVHLYPSITPVNTFRIVLDGYFYTNLGILKDKIYYSTWFAPYRFTDITTGDLSSCK